MYRVDIISKLQHDFANSSYVRCQWSFPFHCNYLREKKKEVVGMSDHAIVNLQQQHITCMSFSKGEEWSFASVRYLASQSAVREEVIAMIRTVASCMHEAVGKWFHRVIVVAEGHPKEARCHVLQLLMGLSCSVSSDHPCPLQGHPKLLSSRDPSILA